MKRVILAAAALVGLATAAVAACSTHTYVINGRLVTCTTCCTGSHCTTNCI